MNRLLLPIFICLVLPISLTAQYRSITRSEYERVDESAGTETKFPFIFTVTTQLFDGGKLSKTVTEIDERVTLEKERQTKITVENGKKTTEYQLRLVMGQNFCSVDGNTWQVSKYECYGPVSAYSPREPERVEYGVRKDAISKSNKTYREYKIFSPIAKGKPKEFQERLMTIDPRGVYVRIVDIEGTLRPYDVRLVRAQVWDMNTKIKEIVAPPH